MPNPTMSVYRGKKGSAPPPSAPPPAPTPVPGPSFFSTMVDGIALGTGSALGHRAIDTLLGTAKPKPSGVTPTVRYAEADPCKPDLDNFIHCITDPTATFCDDLQAKYVRCKNSEDADRKI
jgi:hypothetical protein